MKASALLKFDSSFFCTFLQTPAYPSCIGCIMPAFEGVPCCDLLRRPLGPILHTFFMNGAPFYYQNTVDGSRQKVDHVQHHLEHYSESIQGSRLIHPTGRTFATNFLSWSHEHIIGSHFYIYFFFWGGGYIWLINHWWTLMNIYHSL